MGSEMSRARDELESSCMAGISGGFQNKFNFTYLSLCEKYFYRAELCVYCLNAYAKNLSYFMVLL